MNPLRPITVYDDDLIDDPRFWSNLYWYYFEARVGDGFADGLLHFLEVTSESAKEWLDILAALPVPEEHF